MFLRGETLQRFLRTDQGFNSQEGQNANRKCDILDSMAFVETRDEAIIGAKLSENLFSKGPYCARPTIRTLAHRVKSKLPNTSLPLCPSTESLSISVEIEQ